MKYRMYVDEVGHASHKSCDDELYRYLSLTGVIIGLEYVKQVVAPALAELKNRIFDPHPDEPLILHRQDIVKKRPPFDCLYDEGKCREFDEGILALFAELDYAVVTVVIDKREQLERYLVWQHDPYHYGMQVLLERYVMWLHSQNAWGDVLAESRGGREDARLKASFARICEEGTDFVSAERIQAVLTSKELKVKLKISNVPGLQIADLIAHPSRKELLQIRGNHPLSDDFGDRIVKILRKNKYLRSPSGSIAGWGTEWLP